MICKTGYQNVGGSGNNAHGFLERCKERGVDIAFTGEAPWYRKGGTTTHPDYELISTPGKDKRVMAYRRKGWETKVEVEEGGEKAVLLKAGDMLIGGVYGASGMRGTRYREWLEGLGEKIKDLYGCIMGDWNAHHKEWATEGDSMEECARGRELWEWMGEGGWAADPPGHPTWERNNNDTVRKTTIDLVIWRGNYAWGGEEWEKLMSDHWAVYGEVELNEEEGIGRRRREVVDWEAVERTLEKEEDEWYPLLEGGTAYEKLVSFRKHHLKIAVHCSRSKRWWDEELTEQLRKVRKERRGGVGERAQSDEVVMERVRKWKGEAARMRYLVKEKKEKCWRRFCEESGEKDPWEVVRWAKDPLRLKERMKR